MPDLSTLLIVGAIALWVATFAISAAVLAEIRGRDGQTWAVFGAIIGPLALVRLALAVPGSCPDCGSTIRGRSVTCEACGRDLRPRLLRAAGARAGRDRASAAGADATAASTAGPTESASPIVPVAIPVAGDGLPTDLSHGHAELVAAPVGDTGSVTADPLGPFARDHHGEPWSWGQDAGVSPPEEEAIHDAPRSSPPMRTDWTPRRGTPAANGVPTAPAGRPAPAPGWSDPGGASRPSGPVRADAIRSPDPAVEPPTHDLRREPTRASGQVGRVSPTGATLRAPGPALASSTVSTPAAAAEPGTASGGPPGGPVQDGETSRGTGPPLDRDAGSADLFQVPGSVTSTTDDFFDGLHRRVERRD